MTSESPEPPRSKRTDAASGSGDAIRAAVQRQLEEAPDKPCAPPAIPDHALLHRIGAGAYGDVWLARNALGTLRAVKIVYRSHFKEDRPYEREFNGILKYEPVSRTHEGLVQVLHVGRNDEAGCFYYVMELADAAEQVGKWEGEKVGKEPASPISPAHSPTFPPASYSPRTLRSELARHQRLPPADAAKLVLRLASGLGHLHAHGLVHRDIKPSNVIFVGGQPKLADIGLVTDIGSSRSFVGTEGFIPPEGPGTPQADLYGLGKLLYELATGRDRLDFPQLPPLSLTLSPSDGARGSEGEALLELNEVMARACAPEPQQRYATATELQAELNLFLAGRSLRRVRNIERHIVLLKRFAVAACAFLVLAAAAVWFAKNEARHASERASAANERARTEAALRQRAEAAEHESREQLYTALLEQARATVLSGELGHRVRALDALRRAAAISNNVELRREVFAALALPDLRFERELAVGPDATVMQLDPDFKRLALCRGRGQVEIRSVPDDRLLASLPASAPLMTYNAQWSGDGRYLAVKRDHDPGGKRADWEVWEVANARRILLLRDVSWNAVSFHPLLNRCAAVGTNATLTVWNLEDGNEITRFTLPAAPVHLKYSPDGTRFAFCYDRDGRGFVSVHNAADAAPLASQAIPRGMHGLDWHPSGRWLATGGDDSSVNLIDSHTGELRTLGRHKANAVWVAFSPDGGYLVSGGWERELICWDLQTMRRAFTMALDSYVLQFRADGRECAVLTRVGEPLQLHAFERPSHHREFAEDLGSRLANAAFSPDGRWLAASGDDALGVWDLNGRGPGALASEGAQARLFFTPDSSELFASYRDGFRWQIAPGSPLDGTETAPKLQRLKLRKPQGFTSLCVVSNRVAMTSSQGTRLVTSDNGTETEGHWARTSSGMNRASPDGQWLAIFRSFTPLLHVYRLPGLEEVAKLTTTQANIRGFEFSPLGDELAVGARHLEFWSTTKWQRTRVLTNFIGILHTPDAGGWWLMRDSRTAGLYDARTQQPLLPLPVGMFPLAISPDGRRLAVSVNARRLQVWNVAEVRERLRELGLDWQEGKPLVRAD